MRSRRSTISSETDSTAGAVIDSLLVEAEEFARRLSMTVRAAFGSDVPPFVARTAPDTSKLTIRQDPRTGIVLKVDGVGRVRLMVEMWCVWDHARAFLAVDESRVSVEAIAGSSEPLFRYEFLRSPTGGQAGAHLQVHAHRDAMTYLMTVSGNGSVRARRRRRSAESNRRVPQLSDIHFPLGGPRYRPCLEDVLQMLMDELGVDAEPDAREALAAGRESWRLSQIATCVRDSPETAARVLDYLGYTIVPPDGGHPPDRQEKLRLL